MKTPAVRDGGVELLRSVLMLCIIGLHIMVHGAGLYNPTDLGFDSWARLAINSVFAAAVNAFIFISGYYGIKLRAAPLVKILSQCWFYSVVIGTAFLLSGLVIWKDEMIWQFVFPLSSDLWWFISCYVVLMFFSPLLNAVGNRLEQKHLAFWVVALLTVEAGIGYFWNPPNLWGGMGYTPINFIVVYMVALYLRRFHTIRSRGFYILVWLGASVATFAVAASMALTGGDVGARAYSYNSPLLILSAAAVFFCFKNLPVNVPWISGCAPMLLGVYMIHEHPWVRSTLYSKLLKIHTYRAGLKFFVVLPVAMLGIFVVGIAIEALRQKLFSGIEKTLLQWGPVRAIDEALAQAQTNRHD